MFEVKDKEDVADYDNDADEDSEALTEEDVEEEDPEQEEDVDMLFDKAIEEFGNEEDEEAEEPDDGEEEEDVEVKKQEEDPTEEEQPLKDEESPQKATVDEPDEKPDNALAEERAKRIRLEAQAKKTLEAFGIKVEGDADATEALEKAAAEAEGVSVDEYRKRVRSDIDAAAAKESERHRKFEELASNDLAELKKSFPGVLEKGNIRECFNTFDDFVKFGKLRDAGIGAKDAYVAVNGSLFLSAKSAAQKAAADNKGHIKTAVPKGATGETVTMTKADLKEWRDLFPNMTDKEIRKLYRETI